MRDYALRLLPDALTAVRDHSGEPEVYVLGYSLGGLFALLYAGSVGDAGLRNLVTVASPVDMQDATLVSTALRWLNRPVRLLRRHSHFRVRQIEPQLMHVPGRVNALAFRLIHPLGSLTRPLAVLRHLDDRERVAAHVTTSRWMNAMLAYPGALVQDFLVKLAIDNALAGGAVRLGDVVSDFARIECSLLAIAGESDRMVGAASVQRIMALVASPDRTFALVPGGHAGVFAGRSAPAHTWRIAADWLALRSD